MKLVCVTRLPTGNPAALLGALEGPVDPDDLLSVDEVRMQPEGDHLSSRGPLGVDCPPRRLPRAQEQGLNDVAATSTGSRH